MSGRVIATLTNSDNIETARTLNRRERNAASARRCRTNRKQAIMNLVSELNTARELVDRLTSRVSELEKKHETCRCRSTELACPWPFEFESQSQASIYDLLA